MSSERTAHVELSGDSAFSTVSTVGPHKVLNDVPENVGGRDLGITPEEMVISAYGSCTSMTVLMYARRKEWPVERVDVDVSMERRPGQTAKLTRRIRLVGPLDEEQRARLLQIADKCPVHRILSHNELNTVLEEVEHG